jgi:hypothetical protein
MGEHVEDDEFVSKTVEFLTRLEDGTEVLKVGKDPDLVGAGADEFEAKNSVCAAERLIVERFEDDEEVDLIVNVLEETFDDRIKTGCVDKETVEVKLFEGGRLDGADKLPAEAL